MDHFQDRQEKFESNKEGVRGGGVVVWGGALEGGRYRKMIPGTNRRVGYTKRKIGREKKEADDRGVSPSRRIPNRRQEGKALVRNSFESTTMGGIHRHGKGGEAEVLGTAR